MTDDDPPAPPAEADGVRPLAPGEIATAAETLAAAFDDDPLFGWLLPPAGRRRAVLSYFHRRALHACAALGGAFTVADADGGPAAAAIGVVPPGRWPLSIASVLAALDVPAALPTWRFVATGLALDAAIHRLHPREPHVYVYVLGVDPSRQGRGLGARLMRRATAMARAHRCRVHLETANPVNLAFYRRFGLDVTHTLERGEAPPVWAMTTPAEAADGRYSTPAT